MNVPVHPDGLTAEWLTDVLRATGTLARARVLSLRTQTLGPEKGMTGQLVRLTLNYDTAEADAPCSLIAKFSSPDPQTRTIIHSMGLYEREVRFYEQFACRCLLRTPRCYFSAIDLAQGLALLLLEDLGSGHNGSAVAGCSVADAELAVLGLAPFHAQWWGHPLAEEHSWLRLRGFIAVGQVQEVFQQAWKPFLGRLSIPVTPQLVEVGEWLSVHLGRVSSDLYLESPYTLIHNDYQADNLFFAGTGSTHALTVADWQLTTFGHAVVDVAWFLGGSLDSNARRDHELRLLHTYHALLLEHGVTDYPFVQCWDDYRLAMLLPLGRIASAVGMTARPGDTKGGPFEVSIARYCRAVADLGVGELLKAGRYQRIPQDTGFTR